MSSNLQVSGLIPVRNGEKWIPKKIHQIMQMLNNQDQLIVVDDNSSDSTWTKIQRLCKVYSNLLLVKNEGTGIVDALNLGISLSDFDTILRFDIDDDYMEDRKALQLLEIKSGSNLVFADYAIFGDGIKNLGIIPTAVSHHAVNLSLLNSRRTPHPVACFTKQLFNEVGGYRHADAPAEDLGLWIRMSKVGKLSTVPGVLLKYNLNPDSSSFKNYRSIKDKTFLLNNSWTFKQDFITNLDEEIDIYQQLCSSAPLASQRFLLHLLDLMHPQFLSLLNKSNQQKVKILVKSKLIRLNTFEAGLSITLQGIRRRIYRRLKSL